MKREVSISKSETLQRKLEFANLVATGFNPTQAAKRLGIRSATTVTEYINDPAVQAELQRLRGEMQQANKITRERVVGIVEKAIDMAEMISDPTAMLRGAQELNRMFGYYAPEKKEVEITVGESQTRATLESMTDAELLRMCQESEDALDAKNVHSVP